MSLRAIARTFHHSRKTIRKVLRGEGEPKPYPKRQQQTAPKLEEFHDLVLEILQEDETAPPKQRHTRMRIFERLQKEGYSGGYDAVRRFVNRDLKTKAETFIRLDHHPGQRIEADFGEISVDLETSAEIRLPRTREILFFKRFEARSFFLTLRDRPVGVPALCCSRNLRNHGPTSF